MLPPVATRVWWLAAAIAVCVVACESAPGKELSEAQTAIDAARLAGADQYAHDEFAAAEDALRRARQAVEDRDYRLALNDALDARDRAQTSVQETAERRDAARADADRVLVEAVATLDAARAKLAAAQSAKVASAALQAPRQVLADAEHALQESRAAFNQGDYQKVGEPVADATRRLQAIIDDLDAMAAQATGRRRK